jgi:zinc protease
MRFASAAARVALLLALGAVGTPASAGEAPPPALPPIAFEKYELPNGLDVILHEDHALPFVTVNIWYHVGSKNERRGRTGFAHLFEHMMFYGSQHHESDYIPAIEKLGGDVNGSTSEDRTNYWENVPSNELETVLWLESDRMANLLPAVSQAKFDNKREAVKNERREGIDNQPYAKSEEIILSMLYPYDHPYSWSVIGSMEDLAAATLDDVSQFFRTYYTPSNASLCIAGDFDPRIAKALVEKYFASIPPGPPIERPSAWTPRLDRVRRVTAEDNVTLPRVYMAWHSPAVYAPGDAEMDLAALALGRGKTSRLYKALVYEQQIAQDVSVTQYSREIAGCFVIEVTARAGHALDEIEEAVDRELSAFLAKGIADTELANAKAAFEATFVRGIERIGGFDGRADRMNGYNTRLGDPGAFEWDLARYARATRDDVTRTAREWLDLERRAICRIVPRADLHAAESSLDRSRRPSASPEVPFAPPAIRRATLSNGLEMLVVEDHRLPLVQMNLVVKGGWAADPIERPGTASLTADLLDEGTSSRSALQISEEFEKLGATFYAGSYSDASEIGLNVLAKQLDRALPIMADVVMRPRFPAEELERKRAIYLGQIQQEADEPTTVAIKTFYRTLFGAEHPYGQPFTGSGTTESIEAITRDDLVAYYRANYAPGNAAVLVVGDITLEAAREKIEKAFRGWKAKGAPAPDVPEAAPPTATRVCIVDKPGAPQSVIVAGHLGLRRGDPSYVPCVVMNNTLGGLFMSRLNMNLREAKGLTYGAFSFFGERRGVGPFAMIAPVQSESTKEAVAEIVKEMRDIRGSRPPSAAELGDSRNVIVRSFPQEFQTCAGIAAKLRQIVMYDLPDDEWQRYARSVAAIDGEAVAKAAKEHLLPDAMLIVIVGDRAKIEPEIRELKLGEIVNVDIAER